ncbi:uncharacterized protein B0P05DRAFT_544575 [Gilbertella persicaria]|uniref:uncharacterized protein n=1 Tax=Gilbertella persicaria TaxID=101096 RepID=UPI00221F6959|nr:uncharacterized protein B0P05DRAFT_544575 [Gilbertella persicaria]KAI8077318.1 hypothetical protein B0P05DRAFT_544575 [Gilbertella persicaria]
MLLFNTTFLRIMNFQDKASLSIHKPWIDLFLGHFYHPTPAPETVVVHSVPKKTNDACCWGW